MVNELEDSLHMGATFCHRACEPRFSNGQSYACILDPKSEGVFLCVEKLAFYYPAEMCHITAPARMINMALERIVTHGNDIFRVKAMGKEGQLMITNPAHPQPSPTGMLYLTHYHASEDRLVHPHMWNVPFLLKEWDVHQGLLP
jgi:hypothetical protein